MSEEFNAGIYAGTLLSGGIILIFFSIWLYNFGYKGGLIDTLVVSFIGLILIILFILFYKQDKLKRNKENE